MTDLNQENQAVPSSEQAVPSSEIVIQDYEFNLGSYFSAGWSLFASNMGGFIGFTFLLLVINLILAVIPVLGTIGSVIINAPLSAGYYIVAKKLLNDETTTFGDFFKGFDYLLPLFLASLVSGIFIVLGLFILLIPGLYLAVAYMFTSLMVIHKNLSFFEAMEASRKLITKKWFMFLLFALLIGLINIVGLILLGIGMLFTIPFTVCAVAVAFDDIMNKQTA